MEVMTTPQALAPEQNLLKKTSLLKGAEAITSPLLKP
jgi:hypothetical protein